MIGRDGWGNCESVRINVWETEELSQCRIPSFTLGRVIFDFDDSRDPFALLNVRPLRINAKSKGAPRFENRTTLQSYYNIIT